MHKKVCKKQHRKGYVICRTCVIYRILLACGNNYIRKTGRCINDRLREHSNKLNKPSLDGFLAIHSHKCRCVLRFEVSYYQEKQMQINYLSIPSAHIEEFGNACVSQSSMSLSKKELEFLHTR